MKKRLIHRIQTVCIILFIAVLSSSAVAGELTQNNSSAPSVKQNKMSALKPVYEPLAEWIVTKFGLTRHQGIGIDLGSGKGDLILHLCQKTEMHWINADIDTKVFPHFFSMINDAGFGGRVSATFADAKDMPFRSNYADVIVSRGSFPFWGDTKQGLKEVYRVLKPGGAALIGRGFSPNLPVETARAVRSKQNMKRGVLNYSVEDTAKELEEIMKELNIKNAVVHLPKPQGSDDVKYGLWLEFHKPE